MKKLIRSNYFIYSFFFLTIVLIWETVMLRNGLSHIWKLDGAGQYYPAFLYSGKYIREFFQGLTAGNIRLPAFDLSVGIGENITGCLNYYGFGDPLNLTAAFATLSNGAYVYSFSYILRLFLAGLSFIFYCENVNLRSAFTAVAALCYTFSDFAIEGCARYIEWGSALVWLPLVICGAEKYLREKKRLFFILSVTLTALCGFYFLYMISICLAAYILIRLFAGRALSPEQRIPAIFRLILYYIAGLVIASPVFVPAVEGFLSSGRHGRDLNGILLDPEHYLPSLKMLKNYFILGGHNYYPSVLILYVAAFVILLLIRKNKTDLQVLIAFILAFLTSVIPISRWLFNGFGESNTRFMFIVHFAMSVCTAYSFKQLLTVMNEAGAGGASGRGERIKKPLHYACYAMAFASIIFNILILYTAFGINWKSDFVPYEEAGYYVTSPFSLSSAADDRDAPFRVAFDPAVDVNGSPRNDAMLNDYYGMTYWFSMINRYTHGYVNSRIEEPLDWRSFGVGSDPYENALCGVKYYVTPSEKMPEEYSLIDKVQFYNRDYFIFRNECFDGFAVLSGEKEGGGKGSVSDERYDNSTNVYSCRVISDGDDNRLIIRLPYSRKWRLKIDGTASEVKRVGESMFISCEIPEGEHSVVLSYDRLKFI